jgi:DNA modification methylase
VQHVFLFSGHYPHVSEGRIGRWLPRKAFTSQEDFETFEKLVKEKVAVIKKV